MRSLEEFDVDKNVAVFFKAEKETLRFSVVKVLAAAAQEPAVVDTVAYRERIALPPGGQITLI